MQAIDAKTDVGGTDDGNITVNGDVKAITTAEISTDNGDITVGATGAAVTLEAGSNLTVQTTSQGNMQTLSRQAGYHRGQRRAISSVHDPWTITVPVKPLDQR